MVFLKDYLVIYHIQENRLRSPNYMKTLKIELTILVKRKYFINGIRVSFLKEY